MAQGCAARLNASQANVRHVTSTQCEQDQLGAQVRQPRVRHQRQPAQLKVRAPWAVRAEELQAGVGQTMARMESE